MTVRMGNVLHKWLLIFGIAILVAAALPVGMALADGERPSTVSLDIKEQPLGTALNAFAQQSGLRVIFFSDISRGVIAPRVAGTLSPEAALKQLLANTSLSYEFVDQLTVAIRSKAASGADLNTEKNASFDMARVDSSPAETGAGAPAARAANPNGVDTPGSNGSGTVAQQSIEEMVVTAQKREEKTSDIPFTLSTLTGESLERRNVTDAQSLSFAVPSLGAFNISPGQTLISIRGVSTFRGESALVGLYMDDIPLTGGVRLGTGSGLEVSPHDLSRVEVLKGPQGTLFGEGAIGGVIRYITTDPSLNKVEGRVSASYFNTESGDGGVRGSGAVNIPIVDDLLGVRISAMREQNGGWINNVTSGETDYNDSSTTDLRVKALYVPTEDLRITALANVHRLHADGTSIVNQFPLEDSLFRMAVGPDHSTEQTSDFEIYNLGVVYDFGGVSLTSSTSYFDFRMTPLNYKDQVAGNIEYLSAGPPGEQTVTAQELRLASNADSGFKWILGGNYKQTRNHGGERNNAGDTLVIIASPNIVIPGIGAGRRGFSTSRILTGFADGSFELFDKLELGGGVRYYDETREQRTLDSTDTVVDDREGKFKKTTYRAFGKYQLTSEINLYANVSTGFRSGELNNFTAIQLGGPPATLPETALFYEAGMKASFLAGKLGADVAVFHGTYEDQIQAVARTVIVNGQPVLAFWVDNAGEGRVKGVEWQFNLRLLERLTLGLNGDVTDTEYRTGVPPAPVAPGDPFDFVPEYNVNLTADYTFNWSPEVPGFVSASSSWKGPMQNTNRGGTLGAVPIDRNEPVNLIDLIVGADVRGLELSVFARNLLDERGRLAAQFTGLWPQLRPRSIGMQVSKSF